MPLVRAGLGRRRAAPLWPTRISNFDRILAEDPQFAERIQKSVQSPGFRGMTLNYQERRIYHWHEELDRRRRAGITMAENLRVPSMLERYSRIDA